MVYPLVQLTEYNSKFSTYIRCYAISVRKRTPILYPTDLCERNVMVLLKASRDSLILFISLSRYVFYSYFVPKHRFSYCFHITLLYDPAFALGRCVLGVVRLFSN